MRQQQNWIWHLVLEDAGLCDSVPEAQGNLPTAQFSVKRTNSTDSMISGSSAPKPHSYLFETECV